MSIHSNPDSSIKQMASELKRRGYVQRVYQLEDGRKAVEFTSPSGQIWLTSPARVSYPLNYSYISRVAREKALGYGLVRERGFSVPFTKVVGPNDTLSLAEASDLLATHGTLVVKPESSSMSRGLTLGIKTPEALETAIDYAREVTNGEQRLLIQKQISGDEIRFTVLDGQIVAALLRQTAQVVGDGERTVAELIGQENELRARIKGSMVRYPKLDANNVPESILGSTRVLEAGEILQLNRSTMIKGGASVYNVLPDVHTSYLDAIQHIMQPLGRSFLVADIVIEDYTKPMTSNNTHFMEFNDAPALAMYYSCRDGRNFDIVPVLADAIDERMNAR